MSLNSRRSLRPELNDLFQCWLCWKLDKIRRSKQLGKLPGFQLIWLGPLAKRMVSENHKRSKALFFYLYKTPWIGFCSNIHQWLVLALFEINFEHSANIEGCMVLSMLVKRLLRISGLCFIKWWLLHYQYICRIYILQPGRGALSKIGLQFLKFRCILFII